VLRPAFVENDERFYYTLVDQLRMGHGYTLRGSDLLAEAWVPKSMYDSAVFFHPPAGIFLFLLVSEFYSSLLHGIEMAQLFCFAAFAISMQLSAELLGLVNNRFGKIFFPALVLFTPILAHTNTKIWLENPRSAYFSLALLFGLLFAREQKKIWAAMLILFSLASTLTRVEGVFPLFFVLFFCWSTTVRKTALAAKFFGMVIAVNAAAAGAWLYYSEALKYGLGRPSAELIVMNQFVRQTVEIPISVFALNFLRVNSTILPSAIVLLLCWKLNRSEIEKTNFRLAGILGLWIAATAALYMILGSIGYSKVLRYFLLTLPPAMLFFALALQSAARLRSNPRLKLCGSACLVLLIAAFSLEVSQGVRVLFLFPDSADFGPWL
jgi:hypothetical protein